MTIFGNRDSSYGSSMPMADVVPLTAGSATPSIPARPFGAPDNRRVILRVHGDESIVVGSAEGENAVGSPARWCSASSRLPRTAVAPDRQRFADPARSSDRVQRSE